mmetsp:Transcript_42866/g.100635  ORF Transcript_42866/g.100635 Transcript_42866/m.100635 type:complete len:482 (-) Transcript_42866:239-1684(-)|eukprot:CAMPEP_0113312052 /NCGR_PEP_ID=MMETSP0010_2-20120614/9033_1 /TAXON_ID=216773 ORGANISM="Corethron hystrix, Strain 308" /NCGR_SAMPLE_ID=MMETSP0010_2 /ASSEMBLY_ACC=CAM_ASM_000155 /LENGTH=481 /DNA_ID=CAMNT_0000167793 /DNA_START=140 /DNA_END=1585 /DNA_ORIENTATION=- /assembly_acc=CAM_ASM_000155
MIGKKSQTTRKAPSQSQDYDVCVIGGGVVGLSVLRTLVTHACVVSSPGGGRRRIRVILLERSPYILGGASGRNSGILCTGTDAPADSLERECIRSSMNDILQYCEDMNVPARRCGSLVCSFPWDCEGGESSTMMKKLGHVEEENHDAGDTSVRLLSTPSVLEMEPLLNPSVLSAVHIPGETVVDPWLLPIAYASEARENGAHILCDYDVDAAHAEFDGEMWTLPRRIKDEKARAGDYVSIRAASVVNATGIFADLVQSSMGLAPSWKAAPRRGQYRIFSSPYRTITCPIQPVPTDHSKGVFVFSTVYDQTVVGPTAEDQESRTDESIDPDVREMLMERLHRTVPSSAETTTTHVGEYVGIRPGTDGRDYRVISNQASRMVTCAGIRSTGLSASMGIGRHVCFLLVDLVKGMEVSERLAEGVVRTPLPEAWKLAKQYKACDSEGSVLIGKHKYFVSHPLTIAGWLEGRGMAAESTENLQQQG